jgi:hypothetical protein
LIDLNIQEQINNSVRAAIENYLQSTDLDKIISESLQTNINNVIVNTSNRLLAQVVGHRDLESEVSAIVNNIVTDYLMGAAQKILENKLGELDLKDIIESKTTSTVKNLLDTVQFPDNSISHSSVDFNGFKLNAAEISSGTYKNFTSTGIQDVSESLQLTVTDTGLVVVNNITAENLLISDNTFTNNLTVEGILNVTGPIADSETLKNYTANISDERISANNKLDIDLSGRRIVEDAKLILSVDTLGPSIINSNLRKLGNLTELTVSGQALICETLMVSDNRVGINTEEARGALSVWDQDAEFTLVKTAQRTMFVGSTRMTDISLGTNNQDQIKLKNTGEIEIAGPVRFNGILIKVTDRIPEQVGEPGELQIMRDGSAIYRCLGQNSWQRI